MPPLDPELVRATVRMAMDSASCGATTAAVAAAASLVREMLWRLTMIKLGGIAAGIVLVGLVGYGAGAGANRAGAFAQGDAPVQSPRPKGKSRPPAGGWAASAVEGPTVLLRIVPDGTVVKKGDIVAELEPSYLRDQLVNQQITARAAEASYREARRAREERDHTLTAYQNDLFPREEREAKGEVDVAEQELAVAEGNLKLFDGTGGAIVREQAELNRRRSELDVARAKLSLEKARNRLHILTHYTKDNRVHSLALETEKAVSNELNRQAAWQLEKNKEAKLERMIAACTMAAPHDGTVVHAARIEPGSTIRERQPLFLVVPPPGTGPERR